jgi:hypothetical protein
MDMGDSSLDLERHNTNISAAPTSQSFGGNGSFQWRKKMLDDKVSVHELNPLLHSSDIFND